MRLNLACVTNTWQTIHNPAAMISSQPPPTIDAFVTLPTSCFDHLQYRDYIILMQNTSKRANPVPRRVWNPLISHCLTISAGAEPIISPALQGEPEQVFGGGCTQCFRHFTEVFALVEFCKESFIAHEFHLTVTEHSTISGHKLHYIVQKFISG